MKTGAHYRGKLENVNRVLRGRVRMRWSERLEFTTQKGPSDFSHV